MKAMRSESSGPMKMSDANAVEVGPGETKELTWTFTTAGTTLYGCHEPGHYASGMRGSIIAS